MRERLRRVSGDLVVVVLAALVLAPVLLERGFVLVGDMTFVPRQPWNPAWLGWDGSVPRAVPADALVSWATHVVPGDLVQKAVLFGALVAAGAGMRRLSATFLVPGARLAPLAAGVLYLWNPWVLERLAIGHWGLVIGYAALPWVALAACRVRERAGVALLVPPLAVAAFASPTGGILAVLVAAALVIGVRKQVALVLALGLAVNLPWLLAGLLAGSGTSDPGGVAAFAARSDSPLGVVGSVLSFGGIWKTSLGPGDRDALYLVLLALVLALAGFAALLQRARSEAVALRLAALGGLGLLLALLPVVGPGRELTTALVEHVAGAGILRDSQKWSALFVLACCVGTGFLVDAVHRFYQRTQIPARLVAGGLVLLPVILLPSLGWGLAGKFEPVRYPDDWVRTRAVLERLPAEDRRVLVLPFSTYQRYDWNGDRAALDPALRFFPGEIVADDRLDVGRTTVAGEDRVSARIAAAIADGDLLGALRRERIRYVLDETGAAPQAGAASALAGVSAAATVIHEGPEFRLYDLGSGADHPLRSRWWIVLVGDLLALAVAAGSTVLVTVRSLGGKRGKRA